MKILAHSAKIARGGSSQFSLVVTPLRGRENSGGAAPRSWQSRLLERALVFSSVANMQPINYERKEHVRQ
jgi:hypothetical protein